jgi:methionine-rich copper-binding protein CopC
MKALMVAILLVVAIPELAHAHAKLVSSVPASETAVQMPPQELVLHFSEAVRLTAVNVALDGEQIQPLDRLPVEMRKDFSVELPTLQAGYYSVTWRALASDSHVMTGTFVFTVGARGDEHAGHGAHDAHDAVAEHGTHDAAAAHADHAAR